MKNKKILIIKYWYKAYYKFFFGCWTDVLWGCSATFWWNLKRVLPFFNNPTSRKLRQSLFFSSLPKDVHFIPYADPDFIGFKCWSTHNCDIPKNEKNELLISETAKQKILSVKPIKFTNYYGRFVRLQKKVDYQNNE